MMKAYCKAEIYKVSFNANEQVAAACSITPDASKYPLGGDGMMACTEEGGKYGNGSGVCFVNADGFFDARPFFPDTFQFEVQYA